MLQKILSHVRRCCEDYEMIKPGGPRRGRRQQGKDSLVLLSALAAMRRFLSCPPTRWRRSRSTRGSMEWTSPRFAPVRDARRPAYGRKNALEGNHFRHPPRIKSLLAVRQKCAAALHDAALARDCRVIALGHNRDDAVETLLLSEIYEGRISCFLPVTYLDRKDVTVIRPMMYAPEKLVRACARSMALPVVENPCPANGNTKRQYVKELLRTLDRESPGLEERLFGAMQRLPLEGWAKQR